MKKSNINKPKRYPDRSRNIFTDLIYFLLNKPNEDTLIELKAKEERQFYRESILQRTGIQVDNFEMLNIHRIGVNVPASYLFDELLRWNGDSTCWPNHIAKVNLVDNKLEEIQIFLFGLSKYFPGTKKKGLFGFRLFHLFDLKAIKIHKVPSVNDADNARYILYECKGGYPIGVFTMYVRSSIPERGEKEMSQLFMMVGFNFFGSKTLSKNKFLKSLWSIIHNRVTSNVVCRVKQLSEWRFDKFAGGG